MSNIADHLSSIRDTIDLLGDDAEKVAERFGADAEGHLRVVEAHLSALLAKEKPAAPAKATSKKAADAPAADVPAPADETTTDAAPAVEVPADTAKGDAPVAAPAKTS